LAPIPVVFLEMGQLLEMQNDLRGALDYYNRGLQAAIGRKG
jgi:hypothetical protein